MIYVRVRFDLPAMIQRFGVFELDPASGELRRGGVRIRVQDQPMRILQELLARPGEVVTREELREKIWGETFVDYDKALNTAIRKLRDALGDSAESPRFIETLPKRGYRFIAPLEERRPPAGPSSVPPPRAGWKPALLAAALAVIILATLAWLLWPKGTPTLRTLAVLPFVNLTGDPRNEYVADGITESLIADLGNVPSLQVISRTSAMQYKNARKPLPKIAAELNVDGIVEGSVLRFGDRARVEVKLIDGPRDALLWSQQYERSASELDLLQRDVAVAVAAHLRTRLERTSPQRPPDSRAYLLYLQGRHRLGESEKVARELFQHASAADPTYAAPYAGLAEAEMFLPGPDVGPYESLVRAKAAAEKAAQLDPTLAEAHASLGLVRMYLERDFVAAEREFRRAIELRPGAVEGHHRFALLLAALGRFDEAIREARTAAELDPFSTIVLVDYGRVLYLARRYEEAVAQYQRALAVDPNHGLTQWFLIQVYDRMGRHDEAMSFLRRRAIAEGSAEIVPRIDEIYRTGGYEAILRLWVEREMMLRKDDPFVRSSSVAIRYAQLGDRDNALRWLDRSYQSHTRDLVFLAVEPQFDPLRGDPRFTALLKKVGLPATSSSTRSAPASPRP